nr:MAG TPA: hypothetical protein [Caudoviricetes sp.]
MYDTFLRYHLSVDPKTFSDEEWIYTLCCLREILKHERNSRTKH